MVLNLRKCIKIDHIMEEEDITKITLTNIIVNSKHIIEKRGFKEKHPLTKELLMPRKVKKIIINA